jgi:hypothetical protein
MEVKQMMARLLAEIGANNEKVFSFPGWMHITPEQKLTMRI